MEVNELGMDMNKTIACLCCRRVRFPHSSGIEVFAFPRYVVPVASITKDHDPHLRVRYINNESEHEKTNKMACAQSEDSDQSGHPPSLIRLYAVRLNVLSYPKSTQRKLIRLCGFPDVSESSLGAQQLFCGC